MTSRLTEETAQRLVRRHTPRWARVVIVLLFIAAAVAIPGAWLYHESGGKSLDVLRVCLVAFCFSFSAIVGLALWANVRAGGAAEVAGRWTRIREQPLVYWTGWTIGLLLGCVAPLILGIWFLLAKTTP